MSEIRLSNMKKGDKGTVVCQRAPLDIRRRLQDMGIVEGAEITCLFQSPLGNPKAYGVRGAVIAIRQEDAKNIIVDYGEEKSI